MIAFACDHGGFSLKAEILEHLKNRDIPFKDYGCFSEESVDYPDFAAEVVKVITSGEAERGILICGTGIGMSMAANKFKGIRAAVCGDVFSAKYTKMHNNANILCLGARVTGPGLALEILDAYLDAEFEGGKHLRRIEKIAGFEKEFS